MHLGITKTYNYRVQEKKKALQVYQYKTLVQCVDQDSIAVFFWQMKINQRMFC